MNTTKYFDKKNEDRPRNDGIIIPFSFPTLRDPAQPLGKKIEPGQSVPDPSKYGPMMPRRSYASMF